MICYKFNGATILRTSSGFGAYSDLRVQFKLSIENQFLDDLMVKKVRALFTGITSIVQPGKFVYVGIKKKVDKKIPEPSSSYRNNIDSDSFHFVIEILEHNTT